jgi:hypothetical protein
MSPIVGFENMILKRVFRPRTEEITGRWSLVIDTKYTECENEGRCDM